MVGEPVSRSDDTKSEWKSIGNAGVYVQYTDAYIALTAAKHIGDWFYAYFTSDQLSELYHGWDTFDDGEQFYDLTVEDMEYGGLKRLCDGDEHIVTLGKEAVGEALDEWDKRFARDETVDFVTYLREQEYLLGITNVDTQADDADGNHRARVSYHSCLTPEETRGLIEDENVTVDRIDFDDKYVSVVDNR